MNQLTVGRGAPSERHTRRPLSSGAKTKSVGFSNQKGAAVSCKYTSSVGISAQSDGEKKAISENASHRWLKRLLCAWCSPFCWKQCTRIPRRRQRTLLGFESSCWNSSLLRAVEQRDPRHLWSSWHEESALMMTNKALNKMALMKSQSFCCVVCTRIF